jgi:hypothetical protein
MSQQNPEQQSRWPDCVKAVRKIGIGQHKAGRKAVGFTDIAFPILG